MITQKELLIDKIKMNKDNPRKFTSVDIDAITKSIILFPKMLNEIRPIAVKDNIVLGGNLRLKGLQQILNADFSFIQSIIDKSEKSLTEKSDLTTFWNLFKQNKKFNFIIADNLNDNEVKEFIIKDNVSIGNWDFGMLLNWDTDLLKDWGLELDSVVEEVNDEMQSINNKNSELDANDFDDKIEMKLSFTIDEHTFVRQQLQKIDANPEQAILKVLNYE
jgi:hypothetical protein